MNSSSKLLRQPHLPSHITPKKRKYNKQPATANSAYLPTSGSSRVKFGLCLAIIYFVGLREPLFNFESIGSSSCISKNGVFMISIKHIFHFSSQRCFQRKNWNWQLFVQICDLFLVDWRKKSKYVRHRQKIKGDRLSFCFVYQSQIDMARDVCEYIGYFASLLL